MRYVISAMMLTATLLTGQSHAGSSKAHTADVGPGQVAWFDISTTNIQRAKEFYGKLFDWRFTAVKGTDLAVEIVAGETPIGDIRVAEGKISGFNGVVYIQVKDIEASCKKAKELTGTVVPGFPFNLSDVQGAIALVVDPTGHPIGLYSKTPLPPKPAPAK